MFYCRPGEDRVDVVDVFVVGRVRTEFMLLMFYCRPGEDRVDVVDVFVVGQVRTELMLWLFLLQAR